jgi:hypothetical protein
MIDFKKVKISTTIPKENADALRDTLGKAGAGVFGNYTFCSFSVTGKGRFKPNEKANPHIGEPNKLETVEEEQIEFICDRTIGKEVIAALRKVHPYEEVIVEILPLIDEDQL